MSELSLEELIDELNKWWEEEGNIKHGMILALNFKGKHKKANEIAEQYELRKQVHRQLLSILSQKEVSEEELEKLAIKWELYMIPFKFTREDAKELIKEYEGMRRG